MTVVYSKCTETEQNMTMLETINSAINGFYSFSLCLSL